MLTIDQLPPYGFLTQFDLQGLESIPAHLQINGAAPDEAAYAQWLDGLAKELADRIWPIYDRTKRCWVGAATGQAVALTLADFQLLSLLTTELQNPIAGRPRMRPLAKHADFFVEEDGIVLDFNASPFICRLGHWGERYDRYDHLLPAPLATLLGDTLDSSVDDWVGSIALRLKEYLQRPRPYQVAMMLGTRLFLHEDAHSAVTPSMISGHALGSVIAGCRTFLLHRTVLAQTRGAEDYWAQLTVDIGDRRVMAGVHYPSDSIASWVCAMRMTNNLFDGVAATARQFLWDAIQRRSAVFRAVAEHASLQPDSPYGPLIAWLEMEATA